MSLLNIYEKKSNNLKHFNLKKIAKGINPKLFLPPFRNKFIDPYIKRNSVNNSTNALSIVPVFSNGSLNLTNNSKEEEETLKNNNSSKNKESIEFYLNKIKKSKSLNNLFSFKKIKSKNFKIKNENYKHFNLINDFMQNIKIKKNNNIKIGSFIYNKYNFSNNNNNNENEKELNDILYNNLNKNNIIKKFNSNKKFSKLGNIIMLSKKYLNIKNNSISNKIKNNNNLFFMTNDNKIKGNLKRSYSNDLNYKINKDIIEYNSHIFINCINSNKDKKININKIIIKNFFENLIEDDEKSQKNTKKFDYILPKILTNKQ